MVFNSAFGRRPNGLGRGASGPDSGSGIPGTTLATSKPKISLPTRTAPQWLLAFCMSCLDAHLLGIDLPNDSGPSPEPGLTGLDDLESWPDLPTGTLGAGGPIPELDLSPLDALPNPFDGLSPEETIDLYRLLENGKENWSRRNRNRHREIIAKVDTSCIDCTVSLSGSTVTNK